MFPLHLFYVYEIQNMLILCLQEKYVFRPFFFGKKTGQEKYASFWNVSYNWVTKRLTVMQWTDRYCTIQYRYILCVPLSVSQYIKYKVYSMLTKLFDWCNSLLPRSMLMPIVNSLVFKRKKTFFEEKRVLVIT